MNDEALRRVAVENPIPTEPPAIPLEQILARIEADDPAGDRSRRRRDRVARPRIMSRGSLAVAMSLLVTAAVILLATGVLGRGSRQLSGPAVRHLRVGPRVQIYPLGSTPTLAQLRHNFAILRRPQTAADRTWTPDCDCGSAARQLSGDTRLARTLPNGDRVFLDVEQFIDPGQENLAAGSYVINLNLIRHDNDTNSAPFGPNTQFLVFPVGSAGIRRQTVDRQVWMSLVPDGVAKVRWKFICRPGSPDCHRGARPLSVTVPVIHNVAARQITSEAICTSCASGVTWYAPDGHVVESFGGSTNLPAPPFVKGGREARSVRVLTGAGVGGAKLGDTAPDAVSTLDRLLGPAVRSHVAVNSCGIDHESVWTSPATADPLTIYERRGRFVGYRYGAPVSEIGLQRGPGAVLTTPEGLTLAETITTARRQYGTGFHTAAVEHVGTFDVTRDGGTLKGEVLPIRYPLKSVTGRNRIAIFGAGQTGCPAAAR